MAKTDDWTTMRFSKVEVNVTAAIVAATPLSTVAWIDLSSIFAGPLDQPQSPSRDVEETPVSGDAQPIISVGPNSARQFAFSFLYTEGETLGTDNIDPYQDLFKLVMEYAGVLPLAMRWSPAGGNTGDNLYTTSLTESFLIGLTDPIGGVTSEKIMFTATIATNGLTVSTL